jgi:hypothetical protein
MALETEETYIPPLWLEPPPYEKHVLHLLWYIPSTMKLPSSNGLYGFNIQLSGNVKNAWQIQVNTAFGNHLWLIHVNVSVLIARDFALKMT